MGQPIEVSSHAGSHASIRIFLINRSLSGMRIEEYADPAGASGSRWVDEMARRLGAFGVTRATIYSASITAEAPEWTPELIGQAEDAVRELYVYYVDGVIPPGDYTGEEADTTATSDAPDAAASA